MRADRKAPPLMSTGRWLILIGVFLLLVLLSLNLYYRSIQSQVWPQEAQIEAIAVEAAELVEVKKLSKHVWDTTTWIVQGLDAQQQELFVWIEEDDIQILPANEAASQAAIKQDILARKPDIDIIRIQPGIFRGEKIWEVYYSRDENIRRYYYEFYRFNDGSFITIYNLPSKFSDGLE